VECTAAHADDCPLGPVTAGFWSRRTIEIPQASVHPGAIWVWRRLAGSKCDVWKCGSDLLYASACDCGLLWQASRELGHLGGGECSAWQADALGVSPVGCLAVHYTGRSLFRPHASIYGVALGPHWHFHRCTQFGELYRLLFTQKRFNGCGCVCVCVLLGEGGVTKGYKDPSPCSAT
jgi:hypothetical protein